VTPPTEHDTPPRQSSTEDSPRPEGLLARLDDSQRSYVRFAGMIFTSMVVMYGVMYLNTYELSHVQWSETRMFMTFLMGASMAVIMLSFMWSMHEKKKVNVGIYVGSAIVFVLALWLVRSQTTVDDTSYMRAMIPHHSIAILTSENAGIDDVRVRELADEIIEAQRREIAEMKWLIADIDDNGTADDEEEAARRPVPDFEVQP
jgi:Na+/proline symporter